jgi:protein AATF/BFR2
LKELNQDQKKKEIDRRASKNRKIRYVVHDKLVNFMTPLDHIDIAEDVNNITKNLFGKQEQNGHGNA